MVHNSSVVRPEKLGGGIGGGIPNGGGAKANDGRGGGAKGLLFIEVGGLRLVVELVWAFEVVFMVAPFA